MVLYHLPKNNCAVVVSSCDAYSDVWRPFFTLFFRYWSDCPFPVYLITNYLIYPDSRVTTLAVGEDKGWASNMRQALKEINAPYFIYLLEDVLFKKPVDTPRILDLFSYLQQEKAAYLRLYPAPGPDRPYKNSRAVGEISQDAPYRTSLMAAIWETKIFESLLKDGENAWEMEIKGTERSRAIEAPFLSVKLSPILKRNFYPAIDHFSTAIKKGRWLYDAIKLCQKEGIALDLERRQVEPYANYLFRKLRQLPLVGKIFEILFLIFRRIFSKPR